MKNARILATILLGLILLTGTACDSSDAPDGVSKLVMHVQSKGYSRDIDAHKFSLFYRAKAPNTIVFVIRTKPDADPGEIRMLITSARDMIEQEAKKLALPAPAIEVDQAPIGTP